MSTSDMIAEREVLPDCTEEAFGGAERSPAASIAGRNVTRSLPVCAPHLFIAPKALAIANRDKHKDAYDLYYVLKHDERGPEALGKILAAFSDRLPVTDAIGVLDRDFQSVDGRGPVDVCRFLGREGDEDLAADVLAFVRAFLSGYRAT
jgi:hypothetical protein